MSKYECHTECYVRVNGNERYRKITEGPDRGKDLQGTPELIAVGRIVNSVEKSARKHFHELVDGEAKTSNSDTDAALSETHDPNKKAALQEELDRRKVKFNRSFGVDKLQAILDEDDARIAKEEEERLKKLNENV